jgi:EmrB/QacA subfamily drug resistance transporter
MHGTLKSPDRTAATGERISWLPLALLAAAQFMVILDITVVNVALPSIGAELHFVPTDLQWVVTAYVLFSGGLLLLGGRAADLIGRRRVFLAGLALFTAASLASGLAPSATALVLSRAAQGLGAAMLTPAALALIATTYSGGQRTTALSVWGLIGAAGSALGVVIGGMLTTWLGWEWVFFVNVPVGALALLLTTHLIPSAPPTAAREGLDLPGALCVVAGLVLLVYALAGTSDHGWGSVRTLVLLTLSASLLAAFALVERRVARPLVPPRTWRTRSLAASVALMLGASGVLAASFFLNSLYLQHVLGWSALESGLGFLPLVVSIGIAGHAAPHVLGHAGSRRASAFGLLLVAGGALLLAAAPDHASYARNLLPGFALLGLGLGLVVPSLSVTSMHDVEETQAGLASGLMTTAHEIGAALGVAAISAIAAGTGGVPAIGTITSGYGDGFLAAGIAAAALAALALVAMPSVRPADGVRVSLH